MTAAFSQRFPVRYVEVDLQGVVHNAHYLAYVDEAVERWVRSLGLDREAHGWDFMVKKATIEWHGGAGLLDDVDVDVAVRRWGRTSFDVGFEGRVGDRPVFSAVVTYVGVVYGTRETAPSPGWLRAAMGEPGA